jgi:general secretion pathway protein E
MEGFLRRTSGIVLVTGPTGSGKTTTLYAALNRINSEERNIITIEDPIEYQLKGVGQIQVNAKIGLEFASGLRSILRQDPDVIMVGEIRDPETAQMAIQASLTGHLVLSTLHTNDAPGAIARLVDMGVQSFLLSSSLSAVLAHRLVRTLCNNCKQGHRPNEAEAAMFRNNCPEALYRSVGCGECFKTGYAGQTGIFEFMPIDDELRQVFLKNVDSATIRAVALSKGMKSLKESGLEKAASGVTSLEEVIRVTHEGREP